MSGKEADERFVSAKSDPRFKRVPRKVRKIEIDDRFEGMFKEDRFKVTYSRDKRGRPVSNTASEDLRRYYRLEGGEGGRELTGAELVCRSRGEIEVDTSSSDSESEDTVDASEQLIHAWAEFDQSVATTDESTTRLAVCSMDWDRVTANDIFKLFSSLAPEQGHILSVKIYPSEYGAGRIQTEEAVGPEELLGGGDKDGSGEEDYNEALETEKLRKYQLNRLLYYYAIVETDSSETADYLYQECNGIEYELTGTRLDLRVVPDEVDFTELEATSVATSDTLLVDYQPSSFYNSALQHTKVQLTWDETDPDRQKVLNQNFSKTDIRELDFQAYLASGSESDESSGEDNCADSEDKTLAKFKSLLTELDSTESSKKQDDVDLEITWEPGKLAPLEETISRRTGEQGEDRLTQWEEYLEKRKEKKKLKKNSNKEKRTNLEDEDETKYDSMFTELGGKRKKVKTTTRKVAESDQKEVGELELLMASDSEGEGSNKKHFNMKEIWKNNNLSQRQKRKLARKGKERQEDSFEMNLNDSRFEKLLVSPMFAPDPSDPQFHQGRNLSEILDERKRRREVQLAEGTENKKHKCVDNSRVGKDEIELLALVRKLKQKSQKPRSKKFSNLPISNIL